MASKRNLLNSMINKSEQTKPFDINNSDDTQVDFDANFNSANLDEEEEDCNDNQNFKSMFKIPEIDDSPNHTDFEQDNSSNFKITEMENEEDNDEKVEVESQSIAESLFKIPDIDEDQDIQDDINEDFENECKDEDQNGYEDENENNSNSYQSNAEISTNPSDLFKIEDENSDIKEEVKITYNKENKNLGENMSETDKKILLKIIEQTKPNFEGLEFLGDDYLNKLWNDFKNNVKI